MKTTEEKAIDIVKQMIVDGQVSQGVAEKYFPELKESEDEEIRKALVDLFKRYNTCWAETFNGIPTDKILAWLEKQDEKPQGKTALEAINEVKVDNANKVEPKFHKGEWITNGDYTWKIVEVKPLDYILQSQDGNIVDDTISYVDEGFNLWTIQDAKDGDVLQLGGVTVIFREFIGKYIGHEHCKCYCSVCNGELEIPIEDGKDNIYGYATPATKEQRDLLFAKMHEAGYMWDDEKKEVRKIEYENYDGEDYGIDGLWHAKNILEKTLGKVDGYQTDDGILEHKCAIAAVNKLYKKKSAWGEKDKEEFQIAIDTLVEAGQHDSAHWLKSIKERIGG